MAKAQSILVLAVLLGSAIVAQAADRHLQIVEFTASVCEPCKRMQPVIAKLAGEGWDIRQLDVASQSELVSQFHVKSVPTIVILRDGREVDRIVGALGYDKLRARFESASTPTTVRGQSPAINAFPMLAASTFGSVTPSPVQPVASAPGTREMTEAPQAQMLPIGQSQQPPMQPISQQHQPQQPQPRHVTPSPAAPTAEAMARAGAATVRIRIDEPSALSFGTGTVISAHGQQALVLTCGHLFRDISPEARLSVDVYHQGRPINVPATVVTYNAKEYDLGLIEFRMPIPIAPVPVAPLAEQPQVGEVAFSYGCDRGADPTRRDTQIKRINRYLGAANVEIHGAPVVGRSGGGLFDARGRLIGVCNAADQEDDEGIYAALPIVHQHIAGLQLDQLNPESAVATLASARGPQSAGVAAAPLAATLASSASPAAGAPTAAAPAAAAPGYWPDQAPGAGRLASTAAPSATAAPNSTATPSTQVHCIIRDAAGQESAILIDRASEELVAMLRQHAAR